MSLEFSGCFQKGNPRDPKVAVIILNWNSWEDTIECLESVYQMNYSNYITIVVDNGSENESIQKIKDYCHGLIYVKSKFFQYDPTNKPIEVIELTEEDVEKEIVNIKFKNQSLNRRSIILIKNKNNYGAAEGRNIGIRFALKMLKPDYILLLDNDTVVPPDILTELVKVAESDKKIGVVAPIQFSYFNPKKQILRGHSLDIKKLCVEVLRLKWIKGVEQNCNLDNEIDWVQISCMLVRKDVITNVGALDSRFFYSWEDLDWCIRIRKAGYKILLSSKSRFWHKVDKPTKPTKKSSTAYYYRARNAFLFCQKNKDYSTLIYLISMIILAIEFTKILRICNKDILFSFCRGIVDGLKLLLGVGGQ